MCDRSNRTIEQQNQDPDKQIVAHTALPQTSLKESGNHKPQEKRRQNHQRRDFGFIVSGCRSHEITQKHETARGQQIKDSLTQHAVKQSHHEMRDKTRNAGKSFGIGRRKPLCVWISVYIVRRTEKDKIKVVLI